MKCALQEDAEFFDSSNLDAVAKREELAWVVLNKLLEWLKESGGDVAVFDATNTTDERRRKVLDHTLKYFSEEEVKVLFIESLCDDPKVLEANLEHKIERWVLVHQQAAEVWMRWSLTLLFEGHVTQIKFQRFCNLEPLVP